ncbi:unnamed protein product [Aspergillus oryzae]|nr:unnamed protein product [Aspergillus oryzae]
MSGNQLLMTHPEFFDGILKSHPILHTSSTPIYSNPSFQILGYALEAMTNQTYKSLLQRDLIKPLGLSRSSYDKPEDDTAIIPGPAMSSFYGVDAGGETARWMKPRAHTSSLEVSVGAPWEIFTLTNPRLIDLYTKQGDLGMYSSMLALSPEHDVGFTILAAGESTTEAVTLITDLTINTLIPALEDAAREEANTQFAGEYSSANASIKITTDDQPGLKVTEWTNESVDVRQLLVSKLGLQNASDLSVRLYPSGLKAPGRVGFRAVFQDNSEGDSGIGPVTRACNTWSSVDSIIYGNVGADEFVFGVDGSGRAVSISPRALRVEIPRVEE